MISRKMELANIKNLRAYMTKMAIDGYVVQLDLSEVREMISLLRNATNNINQIARRANETRNFYADDLKDIQKNYDNIWEQMGKILEQLAKI